MASTAIPPTHLDLLDAATGVLGTVGADGRPQLTAVWFLRDEDEPKLSLNTSRLKVKNLRANPAVSLFVHDPDAPTRYLEIRGDAVLEDDPDYAFAARVGEKYGVDLAEFDGGHHERVILTIRPTLVRAVDLVANP